MRLPYIKMCGFTDSGTAVHAARAGCDLIGLNFFAESPRAVSFGLAQRIQADLGAMAKQLKRKRPVRTVAVMVDPDVEHVLAVISDVKPDMIQFHGDESPRFCHYFRYPFIKAFRLRSQADADLIPDYKGGYCVAHLLDAFVSTDFGGTGRMLSQDLVRAGLAHSKGFLAGGLTPKNVADSIIRHRPYGVDVASGIEVRAGVKSRELIDAFIAEVRRAARTSGTGM